MQFDLEGNLLKEWIGAKDIYKQLGFYSSSISQCAKMKNQFRTAYGYIWLYKDYYEKNGIDINYHLETLRNNRIYQIDNKNNVVNIWENISHLPKQYKPSCIYQAIDIDNIHHRTAYGFIWIFSAYLPPIFRLTGALVYTCADDSTKRKYIHRRKI